MLDTRTNKIREKFLGILDKKLDELSRIIYDFISLTIRQNYDSVKIITDESGFKDVIIKLDSPSEFEVKSAKFIKDTEDLVKSTGLSDFAKEFLGKDYNNLLRIKLREYYGIIFLKIELDDSGKLTISYTVL